MKKLLLSSFIATIDSGSQPIVYPFFYDFSEQIQAQYFLGLSTNETKSSREVYNIFHWISEMGGFFGFVTSFASIVATIFASKIRALNFASMFKFDPSE